MKHAFLSLLFCAAGCAQTVPLNKPPVLTTPALKEYVESFPTSSFSSAPMTVNTAHPIKIGTSVLLYVRGLAATPLETVIKTADPLQVTLSIDQINSSTQLVVVYKSEQ